MSYPPPEQPVFITSISLEIRERFPNSVHLIQFRATTGFTLDIPGEFPPRYTHKHEFESPLQLSARDQLSASVQYQSGCCGKRTLSLPVKLNDIKKEARVDNNGQEKYVVARKNIVVTVAFSRDPHAATGAERPNIDPLPRPTNKPVPPDPLDDEEHAQSNPIKPPNGGEVPNNVPSTVTGDGGPKSGLSSPPIDESTNPGPSSAPTGEPSDGVHLPPTTSQDTGGGPSDALPTPIDGVPNHPVTSDILSICPRFRLLIIGNSGVGKSTLIQSVFGVNDVDVSDASRGKADIDREYVAQENDLFVVHDSIGLEAAEGGNFKRVKEFIDGRRRQRELKDRLHAIWVCVPVPYAGGRVLEAGMEEFLTKRKEIAGNIPVVIVVTKLDLLDNLLITDLRKEGVQIKSIEQARPHLELRRSAFLKDYCGGPLMKAAGDDVPFVAVSTKAGYKLEPTIPELVRRTTSEIERFIKADLSSTKAQLYVATMAQRASIEKKVDLTIEIGKKGFWPTLNTAVGFSDEKLEGLLFRVHDEIIEVWNFHDPKGALQDKLFIRALMETSDLGVVIPQARAGQPSSFAGAMQLLLNDPASLAIALPLAGAVALGKLVYRGQKAAKIVVKCFMAYIVDLINVMKILFILVPQGSINSEDVGRALDAYTKLPYRADVHKELKEFGAGLALLPGGQGVVVDKIETLVRQYNITDNELSLLRSQVQSAPPGRP